MESALSMALSALSYRHAWCVDFEFLAPPGHKPHPVCMVATCAITNETIRLWGDELAYCPFDVKSDNLFIAFYASAETSCFDVLGWPHPSRMLDLFTEFRCLTNGVGSNHGNGLIGAQLFYGLPTIGSEEKTAMRDLIMSGGPWSDPQITQIIAYCESDVVCSATIWVRPARQSG